MKSAENEDQQRSVVCRVGVMGETQGDGLRRGVRAGFFLAMLEFRARRLRGSARLSRGSNR